MIIPKKTIKGFRRIFYLVPLLLAVIGGRLFARSSTSHVDEKKCIGNVWHLEVKSFPEGREDRDAEFYCEAETPNNQPDITPYTGFGAQTADYFEQPSFVVDYFANLTEHYPTNNSGNCGYTAAAMLLSYYDVYWNRYIIPDQFNDLTPSLVLSEEDDVFSSPGINDYYAPVWTKQNPKMDPPKPDDRKSEYAMKYYENEREAYSIYLDYMLARTNDNIVSELYSIALDPNVNVYDFENDPKPSLGVAGMRTVVNHFFAKYGLAGKIEMNYLQLSNFKDYTDKKEYQRKLLREEAIARLQGGQPIVFFGKLSSDKYKNGTDGGGNPTSNGNHAVIAYNYSDDYIIGHMGWKSKREYTHAILDKEFDEFYAFAYLDVSPDLEFTPENDRFHDHGFVRATDLCSHVHGNYVVINYEDNFYHALQCVCGDTYYMPHENVLGHYDERYHRYQCAVCGHERFAEHRFFRIYGVGWRCSVCGDVVEELPPGLTPWTHLYD